VEGGTNTRLALWATFVLALIAIQYASRFAEGTPDPDVLYEYSTAAGAAGVYVFLLLIVLAISGWSRSLLALRQPESWRRALALMGLLLVGIWIAIAILEPFLHGGKEQGLTPPGWKPEHAGAYAANFLVVAGLGPVVEELTFRGLGFSLLARFGLWPAVLLVGAAFALAHGLLNAFPELALFGCALAWLRAHTDSVYPGIVLHSLFNAIALIAAVAL
jgi:membrane protease YdiL (CAAX protease family)